MFEKYRPVIALVAIIVACLVIIFIVAAMDTKLNDVCAKERVSIAGAVSHIGVSCNKK